MEYDQGDCIAIQLEYKAKEGVQSDVASPKSNNPISDNPALINLSKCGRRIVDQAAGSGGCHVPNNTLVLTGS